MSGASKQGDRGGGREGKKKSLNKSKQLKHAIEKGKVLAEKRASERPKHSLAAPAMAAAVESFRCIDCSVYLCSRQFATDVNAVIRRARHEGVGAFVVHITDAAKIEDDLKLLQLYGGELYYALGLTPDVIRKNEKFSDSRLNSLLDYLVQPACVALTFGLDFSRDVATHAQQVKLFQAQLALANQLKLPVILKVKQAEKEAVELYQQFCTEQRALAASSALSPESSAFEPPRVAIHSFAGTEEQLKLYLDAGFQIILNGFLCDVRAVPIENSSEFELQGTGLPLFRLLRSGVLPIERVLVSSDSPHFTPQNIPDAHMRSSRNEPANLTFVYAMLASAYRAPQAELEKKTTENALKFFLIPALTEAQQSEAAKQAEEAKKSEVTSVKAKKGKKKAEKESEAASESETDEEEKARPFVAEASGSEAESDGEAPIQILMPAGRRNRKQSISSDSDEFASAKKGKNKVKGKKGKNNNNNSNNNANQGKNNQSKGRRRDGGDSDSEREALEELVEQEIQAMKIGGSETAKAIETQEKQRTTTAAEGPLVDASDFSFTFACKKCRRTLFRDEHLLTHAGAVVDDTNSARLRDFATCETFFVSSLCLDESGNQQSTDRLECVCGSKIGRFRKGNETMSSQANTTAQTAKKETKEAEEEDDDEKDSADDGSDSDSSDHGDSSSVPVSSTSHLCSCGRPCSQPTFYMIYRHRVDFIPANNADQLKGPRSLEFEFSTIEASRARQEEMDRLAKKEAEKQKKLNKKVKKQARDDQRGNFTQFRNKTFVAKKNRNEDDE